EAEKRLSTYSHDQQVTLMNGDLKDVSTLKEALKNIDIVYTNTLSDTSQAEPIIEAMTNTGVQRLIAASVLDIHDEVVGPFKQWN
ncbi:saccharopine dehydrogenase, partial [Pseudomonas aeruginosa]